MDDPQALLTQLAEEITARLLRGEAPDAEEYVQRHPELAERIRQLFATLVRTEGPGLAEESKAGEEPPGEAAERKPPQEGPTKTPLAGLAPTVVIRPPTPRPSEKPLRDFGDYELLEEIASGGMGVVYRARQKSLNRIVALKMIKAGQLASQEEVIRFHTEAEAAASLQHPNIVTVHEVGEFEGQHFFSMDYVPGQSLADLAARGDVPPEKSAEYVRTVALAIQYAHQHGIVHRDLKPPNVLIDAAGRPKVTDFGLAKRISGSSGLTQPGSALGSPPYMAPEQAAGKTEQVGPAADVYSLGTILYELLTGQPPFEGDTPLETLYRVMETEPKAPRLIDREIPLDLETITLKCLAKEPGDRYESALELAEELERFLNDEAILTRPSGPGSGAFRLTWWIVGAIVAAALFAFLLPLAASWLHLSDAAVSGLLTTIGLGGTAFLRVLKMLVVPLVMASVMSGVISMGDVRRLGRPCGYALLFFLSTTVLSVITGLLLANLFQPGMRALSPEEFQAGNVAAPALAEGAAPPVAPAGLPQAPTYSQAFEQFVLMLCPDSLFAAMAGGNLLPLILFSVVFAGVLTTMGRRTETISQVITGANHAMLNLVMLLMRVAPIGIFCLVAAQFGREVMKDTFTETFRSLLSYLLAVSLGVGVHLFVTLPLILFLLTRRNPYRFMLQMLEALLTAFSTSSSAATLPVTMECATKRAGVSRRSVEFVLPLGTTVNMDGTAIYQACAALFVAQAFGIDLGIWQQLTIVLATVLASIGAPGVPQGGLIALLIVLGAVGLPLEGKAIALIFSVDWLVDRLRTLVNVFGDAVGAAVVERSFRK